MSLGYNENDPHIAAWLRQLIADGHLPDGHVDDRSIADLESADCAETMHFFAGIGGWPYALALAGWPDDEPVWTGSCPCQPFSSAGRRRGTDDARHLWPVWRELIAECRPSSIFGEQVAGDLGVKWLSGVRGDLEEMGYAVGCADLCAAGVGAPHIRQRLYFGAVRVGDASGTGGGRNGRAVSRTQAEGGGEGGEARRLAHEPEPSGAVGGMGDAAGEGREGRSGRNRADQRLSESPGPWDAFDIIPCGDGKARRVPTQSEFQPLATGLPARMVRLRGYGGAIVPQVAAAFIRSFREVTCSRS